MPSPSPSSPICRSATLKPPLPPPPLPEPCKASSSVSSSPPTPPTSSSPARRRRHPPRPPALPLRSEHVLAPPAPPASPPHSPTSACPAARRCAPRRRAEVRFARPPASLISTTVPPIMLAISPEDFMRPVLCRALADPRLSHHRRDHFRRNRPHGLAAAEVRLAALPAPTDEERFALGGVQFLRAIEGSFQDRWNDGLTDRTGMLPLLAPASARTTPTPTPFDPAVIVNIFARAADRLDAAKADLDGDSRHLRLRP